MLTARRTPAIVTLLDEMIYVTSKEAGEGTGFRRDHGSESLTNRRNI